MTSRALKSGTVAFAIAATPESMCVSPQAISVNGSAALTSPSTRPARHAPRSSREALADALAPEHDRDEQRRRDREPDEHRRRRLDLLHRDLDEEVRRAPDERERADQDRVRAGHVRTVAGCLRRTAPVPRATPPSTSASPATCHAPTGSSRSVAA